jgi:lipopolysaccharide/colanic/teichoic acid biosynthesis glycosyltransferase
MRKVMKNAAVQAFLASILCILLGLLIGYIVLLFINPEGAWESILNIIKNFFTWSRPSSQIKQLGNTIAKTMPLILCSLSILFAYKVGLFNIGAAGQYVAGSCACLYAALAWGWSWLPCMLFAIVMAALLGAVSGFLKAYCNVNEVISGIMLNWIALYTANTILTNVKETASPYTLYLNKVNPGSMLPTAGLEGLFNGNTNVTIAMPIAIITAIVIKLTSPGPLIFTQERVGLHNRPFKMFKFRSMEVQTEKQEKKGWTTRNDPRVTTVGKVIRKTSIDELPQLFNVLIGDMSLVGPRPERPQYVEKFREEIPRYMVKHQVRPGMTGWAQVNGYRGNTSIRKRIEYDLYYIENWTIGFDIKILILTVFKGFVNKNAY